LHNQSPHAFDIAWNLIRKYKQGRSSVEPWPGLTLRYFRELLLDELRRIHLPRTLVNKSMKKDRGC
jgi:hypothetical protein